MTIDLDTFLVALYTIVDDLYREHAAPHKPVRPGHRPELSDSEVLTLVICAQALGFSERVFAAYVRSHWSAYFPRLLSPSAFNRRSRDLCGVVVPLVPLVAAQLGAYASAYQALDTVPVPLARCCRGKRHRLFADEASIGRGGADRHWYYGCKLVLAVTQDGLITGFVLAPASTEDHWVGEALCCWRHDPSARPRGAADLPPSHSRGGGRVGPTGPLWPRSGVGELSPVPYLSDGGFAGANWTPYWALHYDAQVLTSQDYTGATAPACQRQHQRWRQIVETINGQLEQVLGLAATGARTTWGLLTRVAAKLLAVNLGIGLNRLFGRPDLALASLFSLERC